MDLSFENGTLLWYWYEYNVVIGGFLAAVLVAVFCTFRRPWNKVGLLFKLLLLAAAVSALPLTLDRLGVDVLALEQSTAGVLSLFGVGFALVLGLPYFYLSGRLSDPELAGFLSPHFRTTEMAGRYFQGKLDPHISWGEQSTAIALLLSELQPIAEAVKAARPRSIAGRLARRSFSKGLKKYLAVARSCERLFRESQSKVDDRSALEGVTRDSRREIANRASRELAEANGTDAGVIEAFKVNSQ